MFQHESNSMFMCQDKDENTGRKFSFILHYACMFVRQKFISEQTSTYKSLGFRLRLNT